MTAALSLHRQLRADMAAETERRREAGAESVRRTKESSARFGLVVDLAQARINALHVLLEPIKAGLSDDRPAPELVHGLHQGVDDRQISGEGVTTLERLSQPIAQADLTHQLLDLFEVLASAVVGIAHPGSVDPAYAARLADQQAEIRTLSAKRRALVGGAR